MKILLLRHAEAQNYAISDAARELTPEGHAQALRVAHFLRRIHQPLDVILTSHYVRARQTAQAVAEKYPDAPLREDQRLGCGFSPNKGLALIQAHRGVENLLLVAHQPDLSLLAASLLTKDQSLILEFGKASLLILEMGALVAGAGRLATFMGVAEM